MNMQSEPKRGLLSLAAMLATFLLTAATVVFRRVRASHLIVVLDLPLSQLLRPTPNDTLHSPELEQDNRVTFRLYAPDAREVKLHAEGMEATPDITPEQL